MLVFNGTQYWTGWVNIWGDWCIHFPFTFNFAQRPFPLFEHPQMLGMPFRYHFAADLISGALLKAGFSLIQSMIFPSIILSILTITVVYYLYKTLFNSIPTAIIGTLIFFFNGGLGVFEFLFKKLMHIQEPWMSEGIQQLTFIHDAGYDWANFVTSEFIPQRPFLLGFPITAILIIYFWNIFSGKNVLLKKFALLGGFITGFMPLIHFHSFYVILGIAGWAMMSDIYKNKKIHGSWILFFLTSSIIAYIIISNIFEGIPRGNFRIHLGWYAPKNIPEFFLYWLKNIGPLIFLIPLGFKYSSNKIRMFSVPFIGLFVLANIFVFQKEMWDNRKFFLYWHLFASGFAGLALSKMLFSKKSLGLVFGLLLGYICTLSGFMDVVNLLKFEQQKYGLFTQKTVDFARQVNAATDHSSVFLTVPGNTWLGMVLGRQIVMGFTLWMPNYGFSGIEEREHDIRTIYTSRENISSLLSKYSIDYIIVGPIEKEHYITVGTYFIQNSSITAQNDEYTVYDVRNLKNKNVIEL